MTCSGFHKYDTHQLKQLRQVHIVITCGLMFELTLKSQHMSSKHPHSSFYPCENSSRPPSKNVHPILDTGIYLSFVCHAHGTPLDSKTGGLESYGPRLIYLNSQTKGIAFFLLLAKKNTKKAWF